MFITMATLRLSESESALYECVSGGDKGEGPFARIWRLAVSGLEWVGSSDDESSESDDGNGEERDYVRRYMYVHVCWFILL